MGNRARETDHEDLEKKVYTEVARCIRRLDQRFFVRAEDQSIGHTVPSSRKIIGLNESRCPDQAEKYVTFIRRDENCLMINMFKINKEL